MSKTTTITLIFVLIVALIGVLSFTADQEEVDSVDQSPATTSPADKTGDVIRTIDALHQFLPEERRHILAGTTTVPTPCHQLTTETQIKESMPQRVTINFSADRQSGTEPCAQVVQEVRFKTSFVADKDAEITGGTYNNDDVKLNLRKVPAGQELDEYQVYTKG